MKRFFSCGGLSHNIDRAKEVFDFLLSQGKISDSLLKKTGVYRPK